MPDYVESHAIIPRDALCCFDSFRVMRRWAFAFVGLCGSVRRRLSGPELVVVSVRASVFGCMTMSWMSVDACIQTKIDIVADIDLDC